MPSTTGAGVGGDGAGTSVPRTSMYEYHTLAAAYDAISSGTAKTVYLNVYARVIECSNVRETRGYSQDKMVNLKLADATTARMGYEEGVELLCFCADEALLPVPFNPGDVIRLHRVKNGEWLGRLQLIGKLGSQPTAKGTTRHFPFSFLLFHGGDVAEKGADAVPYMQSSETYYFGDEDKRQLAALASHFNNAGAAQEAPTAPAQAPAATGGVKTYTRKISEIAEAAFDLLCKVLHVELEDDEEGGEGGAGQHQPQRATTLYVWDGTDARPEPLSSDNSEHLLELYSDNPMVGLRLDLSPGLLKALDPQSVEARYGTILPVRVCSRLAGSVAGIQAGQWITLRRVRTMVLLGQLQGLYTEESRWSGHAEDAALVAAAREKADRNEVSRWAPLTREALARESRTKTRHSRRPFTTLRAIRCAAGATGTPDKSKRSGTLCSTPSTRASARGRSN